MIGMCPYNCYNRSPNGYCKTTGCINPAYNAERYLVFGEDSWNNLEKEVREEYLAAKEYWEKAKRIMEDPDYGVGRYS